MNSKDASKAKKVISQVLTVNKCLKLDLLNTRHYSGEYSIKGTSEAPFKTVIGEYSTKGKGTSEAPFKTSSYPIAGSRELLKSQQVKRYGQGRNNLYAKALISRYFKKQKESVDNNLDSSIAIQETLREKMLFYILQHNSCDSLKKLDLQQLPEDKARLIQLIISICELLDNSMEYVRIWLDSPHPSLGNCKPISYLLEGKPDAVEILIYAVETGQPI